MIALHRTGFATSQRSQRNVLQGLLGTALEWVERHRQRRQLLSLPPELLKDIGLSQGDAWQEGAKPFWRS